MKNLDGLCENCFIFCFTVKKQLESVVSNPNTYDHEETGSIFEQRGVHICGPVSTFTEPHFNMYMI